MTTPPVQRRAFGMVPTLVALACAQGALIGAEPILVHHEDFVDISEWTDLSTLLPWGGRSQAGVSAFTLGSNSSPGPGPVAYQALSLTNEAMGSSSITHPAGLRGHAGLDFAFPTPIHHRYNLLTVSFKARWSAVNPASSEKGRIMVALLGDYPSGGPTVGNESQFSGDPYGRPAYHARLRPTTQLHQTSLLGFGGADSGRFDRVVSNTGSWWLPTFIANTDGSPTTAPGTGAAYPASSWVASNQTTGSNRWSDYRYEIAPDAQRLYENDELIAEMSLPEAGAAPGYQYFDTFHALRLGFRGEQPAHIADLHIFRTSLDLPPIANADSFTVPEDSARNLAVLANDTDPEQGALRIVSISSVHNGTAEITANGLRVKFRPLRHFHGQASFRYVMEDVAGNLAEGEASVTVTPVNDRPIARNVTVRLNEDESAAFLLLGEDIDGDAVDYQILSQPANGVLTGSAPTLIYTPNPDYYGRDTFTYQVTDGQLVSRIATVRLVVRAVNDLPTLRVPTIAQSTPVGQDCTISPIVAWDNDTTSIRARVTVTGGVVTLGRTEGLTFVRGTGVADRRVVIRGEAAFVSNALRALVIRPTGANPGTVNVRLEINDGPGWRIVEDLPITVVAPALPFEQTSVVDPVVMEAENAHGRHAPAHQGWAAVSAGAASQGRAMQALVDRGTVIESAQANQAPQLSFTVVFAQAGTHYVWLRGMGANVWGDSVNIGVDGVFEAAGSAGTFNTGGVHWAPWRSNGGRLMVTIPSAGEHTITVAMREDGVILDQVLLTSDPAYVPTDALPESGRETEPGLPTGNG